MQSIAFADAQAACGEPYALFNLSSATKDHLMRALIGWRTGLLAPSADLTAAAEIGDRAVAYIREHGFGVERYMFYPVPSAYAGILTGRATAAADEMRRYLAMPRPRGVTLVDACDAWLVSALTGGAAGDGPTQAQQLASQQRTRHWGETVGTYFELLATDASDLDRARGLTELAIKLFAQRRRNGFIAGGQPYYGGDLDNDLVIDFHLAAIWRVRGWDPAALSDEARMHVVPSGASSDPE